MADNADSNVAPAQKYFSRRILRKHLQKLYLKDGDVLVVKADADVAKREILDEIYQGLTTLGKPRVLIVVLDQLEDLYRLDEKEMNKYGWYRVPTLKRLIHVPKDGEKGEKPDAP